MNTPIETIKMSDNRILKIYQDDNPDSPREWDNLGLMACFHNRYDLGDTHEFTHEIHYVKEYNEWLCYENTPDGLMEYLQENDVIYLPLYLYDHSGITMSTGSFYDPWDSGQVGYIYVTKERIREEYGWKAITKKRANKILEYLKGEVKEYDNYLTGNVYGFILECGICGEQIDSCWGFYGDNAVKYIQDEVKDYDCEDCHAVSERLDKVLA